MGRSSKTARLWPAIVAIGILLALVVALAAGCGDEATDTTTKAETKATGIEKGKVYVAVTGEGELEATGANMGMAIVDLETKKVEMVNIPEAKAPHGIIFDTGTSTAPDTSGRVATEKPQKIWLGNAEGGNAVLVDMNTMKTIETIKPPAGAKVAVCGMEKGPDGKIWITSMGDGKAYPLDPATGTMGEGVGGEVSGTVSVCGIAWSKDGKYAYLSNMFNPNDPNEPGYVAKVEWPSGKLVKKIENVTKASGGLPMAHQTEMTPDGKYLYVTDGFDGSIVKINLETDAIEKTIPIGKEPHSIVFSPDGKTAYIAVRHEPVENQSSVFVFDVEKEQVIDRIPGIQASLICGLILEQP